MAILFVFYAVTGSGNGPENVAYDTLIGCTVESSKPGQVFGTVFLASSLAAVAHSVLVDLASPEVGLLAAGCGVLFVLSLVQKMLPTLPEEPGAALPGSLARVIVVRPYKRPTGLYVARR